MRYFGMDWFVTLRLWDTGDIGYTDLVRACSHETDMENLKQEIWNVPAYWGFGNTAPAHLGGAALDGVCTNVFTNIYGPDVST